MKESSSDVGSVSPSAWALWLAVAMIVIATFGVYQNSFSGAFVLDDARAITNNDSIRHMWPPWSMLAPASGSTTGGRPLVNLSFAVNYALGGLSVGGYHGFNLLVHLGATLALFGIVRRTLVGVGPWESRVMPQWREDALPLATAVAGLWAVHPLLTASVTYVSQRAESMMGLFYLLTLYSFIRGVERSSKLWLALSVLASGLGAVSKEVIVTAPVAVLLYDRAFVAGTIREAWHRRWKYYLALGSTWLWLAHLTGSGLAKRSVGYGLGVTWWKYLLTECEAVVRYGALAVWPQPLVFDYGPIFVTSVAEAAPFALLLAGVLGGVLFVLWRRPALGFVAVWFFLILAPTSSVVPVALQPIAENRAYLPLASIVTLLVLGLHAWCGRRGLWACAILAVGWGGMTLHRNQAYRDPVTLWRDTVAKRPQNPRAHNNLGAALYDLGQTDESAACYQRALLLDPDYADAHSNLGALLFNLGRVQEAVIHERRALQIRPRFALAHSNLAAALLQLGQVADALVHAERALSIDPGIVDAHFQAGSALLRLGHPADAIPHFEAEIRLRPDFANAWSNLGAACYVLGRRELAAGHFKAALRLRADFLDARLNLVNVLFDLGRVDEVITQGRAVLLTKPDEFRVRFRVAQSLAAVGRLAEAAAEFEAVLRAKPDFQPAQTELAALRAAKRPLETEK